MIWKHSKHDDLQPFPEDSLLCKGLSAVSADVRHWYSSWCPEQCPPIGLRDVQGERRPPDHPGAQA